MKKSIFKSKTFWVNTIAVILSIITIIDPEFISIFVTDENRKVQLLTIIGAITGILNIILRSITSTSVRIKKIK